MAVFAKAISGNDIVNGSVTVGAPEKVAPTSYNPGQPYSQQWASGDAWNSTAVLENRYLYHGGESGSGVWEH